MNKDTDLPEHQAHGLSLSSNCLQMGDFQTDSGFLCKRQDLSQRWNNIITFTAMMYGKESIMPFHYIKKSKQLFLFSKQAWCIIKPGRETTDTVFKKIIKYHAHRFYFRTRCGSPRIITESCITKCRMRSKKYLIDSNSTIHQNRFVIFIGFP